MSSYRSILAATVGIAGIVAVSLGTAAPASAQWMSSDGYQQNHGWSSSPYASRYGDGYYAYGSAVTPRDGRYNRRGAYDRDTPGPGSSSMCLGNSGANSAFPSWMCR